MKTLCVWLCCLVSASAQLVGNAVLGNCSLGGATAVSGGISKTYLISHWKLEEASGQRADAHGSNPLDYSSTDPDQNTGKVGNCADFYRIDQEGLYHADNASLSLSTDTPFAVAFWVNPHEDTRSILSHTSGLSEESRAIDIRLSGTFQVVFTVGNGTTYGQLTTGTLTQDAWAFVVCWHDPAADKLYVSINDAVAEEAAWTGGTQDASLDFYVGRWVNENYFWGLLDEISYFKGGFPSASERTALYNSGNGLAFTSW